VKKFNLSSFYFRSSIFVVLSVFAATLNYILYPILTRVLTPSEFGDFAAVVALSNQVAGVLLAFNLISIYLVKFNSETEAREKAQVVQKVLIWLFLFLTALLFLTAPLTRSLLNLSSTQSIIVMSLIQLSAVPAVIWTGYLQGHKQLAQVGIYNVMAALGKLVFATLLASIGGALGGVWGLLFGAVIGLITLRLVANRKLPNLGGTLKTLSANERTFLSSLRTYIVGSIFVVGIFGILQNFDITLAKALFSPEEAGVYGGISILSNSLYYLSFLLVWVVLPEIMPDDSQNNRRVLTTSYKLIALLAVTVICSEILLRDQLTGFLLGSDFTNQGTILIYASIFQLSLVACALYAFYLLVMRRKRAVLFAASIASFTITLPILFAQTTQQMIQYMASGVFLGVALYILTFGLVTLFRGQQTNRA